MFNYKYILILLLRFVLYIASCRQKTLGTSLLNGVVSAS